MNRTLFDVSPEDVALTTDDWYTPRWLFDAAGLMFDMDVAAPVNPAYRTCPARRYLTAADDGLICEWNGLVWMNPPYSNMTPWVHRWAAHPTGLALLPAARNSAWRGVLTRSADALALIDAVEAVCRVAVRDRVAAGAYHVRPSRDFGPLPQPAPPVA
jgi:DNA N-6-adenine-methyltransferase (Dam)